ncbi:unnamed protein product [Sphagnum jensenii]
MGNSYGHKGKGVALLQGPPKRKDPAENASSSSASSSSGWHSNVVILLNLMMSSLCTIFSWAFPSYMLKFDFSLLLKNLFGCVLTIFLDAYNHDSLLSSQSIRRRRSSSDLNSQAAASQPYPLATRKYLVHDLNPTCNSDNPNLTIIFFHGIAFGTNDEWKETWTTLPTNNREESICWPEKWLPNDLNDNVRILSLSYDSNIVASVHNDVTEIGKNLIQSLVTNSSYQSLWDGPVALVAYSFGGLVLKSMVVEAHKHVHQRRKNSLDDEIHKCCETFLNNVKGVIFYGVPHSGGTRSLSKYFTWQYQQINKLSKYATQLGFSKKLEIFNSEMEYLSLHFKNAIHEDLNIYAFGEGLPLDEHWDSLLRHPSFSFEVPQELPNIIEGVPSQDLELATNSLMDL